MFNVLNNVDRVPSNVQSSHQEALFYVFEDNEAVIKMIIKGRSPTMRHVSRTHNLDPKIQIKYIDTKNQLADMLTKGNFTRDTVCSEGMARITQQDSGGETISTRFRRRTSHSEVEANDESYCKGSLNSVIFGVRKPGEEKL